uniref:PQ-loop repeat-containing protein 1 n=2 Tax=Strongyloides stercoralis TaxID=6248 RepID=A0AAF5I2I7_STRER
KINSYINFIMESLNDTITTTITPFILEDVTLNTSVSFSNTTTTTTESVFTLLKPIDAKTIMLAIVNGLACLFIIFGGSIPYVFQYLEINERKDARGFSLYVCLTLCVANILRILFWFGNHFDIPLLIQKISVRMNKKTILKSQWTSIWSKFIFKKVMQRYPFLPIVMILTCSKNGNFISDFWQWTDLPSFFVALALFTAAASLITAIFIQFPWFVNTLGLCSLLIEACLGLPQLIRNFKRKSTIGMSVTMVLGWFAGDVGKTIYFIIKKTPFQFYVCSSLQITIDILILLEVFIYKKSTIQSSHASSISSKSSSIVDLPETNDLRFN